MEQYSVQYQMITFTGGHTSGIGQKENGAEYSCTMNMEFY